MCASGQTKVLANQSKHRISVLEVNHFPQETWKRDQFSTFRFYEKIILEKYLFRRKQVHTSILRGIGRVVTLWWWCRKMTGSGSLSKELQTLRSRLGDRKSLQTAKELKSWHYDRIFIFRTLKFSLSLLSFGGFFKVKAGKNKKQVVVIDDEGQRHTLDLAKATSRLKVWVEDITLI